MPFNQGFKKVPLASTCEEGAVRSKSEGGAGRLQKGRPGKAVTQLSRRSGCGEGLAGGRADLGLGHVAVAGS